MSPAGKSSNNKFAAAVGAIVWLRFGGEPVIGQQKNPRTG